MKILIIGSGLMGPAAAYNALCDPQVENVTIADINQEQLSHSAVLLKGKPNSHKLHFAQIDISEVDSAVRLMKGFDAAIAALPKPMNHIAIKSALHAQLPLVDLAQTLPEEAAKIEADLPPGRHLIIIGCGVEPGLTEIVARHMAEKMDRVDECHIKCGGIPAGPKPPLGYKIVFGGKKMPLHETDAEIVRQGKLEFVPRYSGIEPVAFPGVGQCEAWHEGFKPWILDLPTLNNIRSGTQKTVRWPGYAHKITVLKELGLLSLDPVQVDGQSVIPKHLLDSVLYPAVKLEEGEQDITCFRVELVGEMSGTSCVYQAQMVDHFDEQTGFTSMARTTAFTGAIAARMIASGKLAASDQPIVTPEKLIAGPLFDTLLAELEKMNINLDFSIREIPEGQVSTQD